MGPQGLPGPPGRDAEEQDEIKRLTTKFEQEIRERNAKIEEQRVKLAEQEGRIAKQEEKMVDHEQKIQEKFKEQERMISKYGTLA